MAESRGFGERGEALYAVLAKDADEGTRVLAEEAARVADRLDDLDQIIAGKGVLDLLRFRLVDREGRVAEVKFDGVLSEARQQASVLRQMLVTLGVGKAAEAAPPAQKGTALDELRARRESGAAHQTGAASV